MNNGVVPITLLSTITCAPTGHVIANRPPAAWGSAFTVGRSSRRAGRSARGAGAFAPETSDGAAIAVAGSDGVAVSTDRSAAGTWGSGAGGETLVGASGGTVGFGWDAFWICAPDVPASRRMSINERPDHA